MKSPVITIIDFGSGNIGSIIRMIEYVGGKTNIITSPHSLKNAKKILMPGVGAFDNGIKSLTEGEWIPELSDLVLKRKVPVLGICLGMQLMCVASEEGTLPGLGWIKANVKKFSFPDNSRLKVPHMGWNVLQTKRDSCLIDKNDQERFYFVHSYYVNCHNSEDIVSITSYGHDFVSCFSKDNIYGTQFHPEKSHKYGMRLMKRFLDIPC